MAGFSLVEIAIWFLPWLTLFVGSTASDSSWCPQNLNPDAKFKQRAERFYKFDEQSSRWVEIRLPFDLMSCVNENCTKVDSIRQMEDTSGDSKPVNEKRPSKKASSKELLPLRRRVSLTKMSDASFWVTGQSGSIYERFWNGLQWMVAPHELPILAGGAISVFNVNHSIMALSEAGILYQMQMDENSRPFWAELTPSFESSGNTPDTETSLNVPIRSGVRSADMKRLYFVTKNGSLLELSELQPPRWIYHERPPGADVAAIADAAGIRPCVVFTISSTGDLYELDKSSKPSWKKHIWSEMSKEETSLKPQKGCTLHGVNGAHSQSIFLLTKGGDLLERRLNQRKWKWIEHRGPKGHHLTSITAVTQNELNEKIFSLFSSTANGILFEYRLHKKSGAMQVNQLQEAWVNHMHPPHARVARSVPGVQLQVGRMLFMLDDGRLSELHLSGIGGEDSGPNNQMNLRRKMSLNYEWSVLDAPESEGWNAEYCTEEQGPLNCMQGFRDAHGDDETSDSGITSPMRRRKEHLSYISPYDPENSQFETSDQNKFIRKSIESNFHMRTMQEDRSFFIITDGGLTFEYILVENVWIWLTHEHTVTMKGLLGKYNGSLFVVDTHGNLLTRERDANDLLWVNCTAMKRGKHVQSGPPWDGIPGVGKRITAEDAMFFVSRSGRLVQFTVALRKFKWKDCRSPPNTKIASIVDQEVFRMNIVFVMGRDGRLYQYNRVTEIWHAHYQSPHLILSKLPGTALRHSFSTLVGSLFMFSADGGLVEYHWNTVDGWIWVEHGAPNINVTLVGAPGPSFDGNKLFVVGSDGNAYIRYYEQRAWHWKSYGFPYLEFSNKKTEMMKDGEPELNENSNTNDDASADENNEISSYDQDKGCDLKVAPVRPIAFSGDSIIYGLRDGRLAELRRSEGMQWKWSRIIGTPTSTCTTNYWTEETS